MRLHPYTTVLCIHLHKSLFTMSLPLSHGIHYNLFLACDYVGQFWFLLLFKGKLYMCYFNASNGNGIVNKMLKLPSSSSSSSAYRFISSNAKYQTTIYVLNANMTVCCVCVCKFYRRSLILWHSKVIWLKPS